MLVKYDSQRQLWVATCTIDGQPVMCISRNMSTAMRLLSLLVTAPTPVIVDESALVMKDIGRTHIGRIAANLS